MKITTETGSVYELDHGIWRKFRDGELVGAMKAYIVKAVPNGVRSIEEIYAQEEGQPEIGKRLFLSGKDEWWISTTVVSIED